MAPRKKTSKNADALLADLRSGLESLVAAARQEGRDEALAELRKVIAGGSSSSAPAKRSRKRSSPAKKPAAKKAGAKKTKRRNPWEGLTDEQRLARVNAIRKGRGLPPKDAL